MPPRSFSLLRLIVLTSIAFYFIHFISSSSTLPPTSPRLYDDSVVPSWREQLGLDHYMDLEDKVRDKLANGAGKLKASLQTFTGGLGWGGRGIQLGSLYSLIATSNASPRIAYYDKRTSLSKFRLASTRVLGIGSLDSSPTLPTKKEFSDSAEEDRAQRARGRRHLLITGGFGSLAKHVVRDLLLGLTSGKDIPGPVSGIMEHTSTPIVIANEDVFITILDIKDRTEELDYLLQTAPIGGPVLLRGTDPRASQFTSKERSVGSFRRSNKLRIIIGDVRNDTLIKSLLTLPAPPTATRITEPNLFSEDATIAGRAVGDGPRQIRPKLNVDQVLPPITGIIHLAAYSPRDCRLNPVDCLSVSSGGMTAILNSLKKTREPGSQTLQFAADRPWIVIPRRIASLIQNDNRPNLNSSQLAFQASEDLLKAFTIHQPLHSLILQLPDQQRLIGDPFAPRFDAIPHMIESALGHLPIIIKSNSADIDEPYLAMEDAAKSIVQGARMLNLASKKSYVQNMGFVAEVNVIGPIAAKGAVGTRGVVDSVIAMTRSESPFVDFNDDAFLSLTSRELANLGTRTTSLRTLGMTPEITVQSALQQYLASLLQLQSKHLSPRAQIACSSPPSTSILEEGFLSLSRCNVQLLTLIGGAYSTLGCSSGSEGPHLVSLAMTDAVPYKEGLRTAEIEVARGSGGRLDVRIRCPVVNEAGKPTGESSAVIWTESQVGGLFVDERKELEGITVKVESYSLEFVERESRSFTIALSRTQGAAEDEPIQKLVLKGMDKTEPLQVHFQAGGATPLVWKVNPICCPNGQKKAAWDYFKEDPLLTSQVTYPSDDGRTTLLASTLSVQRCQDLRGQNDIIEDLQKSLSKRDLGLTCKPARGQIGSWAVSEFPTCTIDCTAPIPCIASANCRCTRDRCGSKQPEGPFPDLAFTNRISYGFNPPAVAVPSIAALVDAVPLESMILPGAKLAFNTSISELPKAYVVELPKTIDTHMTSEACYKLDKSPVPFLADHTLVEALRNRSVSLEKADFVMVPFYQGCSFTYLQENVYSKLSETITFADTKIAEAPQISSGQVVIPFTHDYGSCTGWWPRLADVLGRNPPSPMDSALAWQVNGDYNTRCIKPDQDVVIPALTKLTKSLTATYSNLAFITPSGDRPHLAFFAGGIRGFGALARTRIGCGIAGAKPSGTGKILYQKFAAGEKYLGTLNKAKFCLLPRGIPAWTERTFEAIYVGCIPVFLADRNIFPYQDILDYSLFSITIPENEAHKIEFILSAYSEGAIARLQIFGLRVRDAFLYDVGPEGDGMNTSEWEREKGPLFWSLVSMKMRLGLKYGGCSGTNSKS